jgi:hypothetical protein
MEKEFSGNMKHVSTKITEDNWKALKIESVENDITLINLLENIIDQYVKTAKN